MVRLLVNRRVLGFAAVVAGLLTVVLWPTAVQVDVAAVSTGPLVVTVDEEGVTRVRDRIVVSAPRRRARCSAMARAAEVTKGLADGTRVILHPGDTLVDGARVRERLAVNGAQQQFLDR